MSASTMNTISSRKRNNSIIPIEFRNDTNGGMERAALATVFGVKEYTESKIFWNSEEEQEETTSFKPVQRSTSKRSTSSRHVQHNSTTSSHNKVLPIIPVVSEFGDIWSQVNHTTTPENNNTQFSILPPADLSDYPLTLFDLIKSDENSNLILWGIHHNTTIPPTAPNNTHEQDDSKKKKSRWSAQQFLPDSLRKKPTLNITSTTPTNNHNTTTTTTTTTIGETRVIEAATIEKLVEKLTVSLGTLPFFKKNI